MKRIAIIAVTIVALVAMLVAALPYIVPGEFLRSLVATRIAAWTGRPVVVTGEPRLSIYPDLTISVDGLTVGNPGGESEESFLTAEGVTAAVRVLPLLVGRMVLDELQLIRPRFRLIVGEDGSNNWQMDESSIVRFAIRARDRALGTPSPDVVGETPPELLLPEISLGRILIVDGIVLYDDLASDHREEMSAVGMELSWPSSSAPLTATGSLLWRGEPFKFNGSIGNPLALIAGGKSAVRFAAAATILRAAFSGEASSEAQLQLVGRATAMTPALRRAIEWTGVAMGPGSVLGAASIEGKARWVGQAISWEDANISLDGNEARGNLSLVLGTDGVALDGSVETDRLDLTPYLEASRADLTSEGTWLLKPTQLDFAEAIEADLAVTAGEVLAGDTRLENVNAGLTIRDNAIRLEVEDSQFYGGQMTARFGAGMVGDELVAGLEAEVAGLPLETALTGIFGIDTITGTAISDISLNTRGATWGELARGASGTAAMTVTGGAIEGIDVVNIVDGLGALSSGPAELRGGSTKFSRLTASVGISGGSLSTGNLRVTGPGYAVDLNGKGSLLTGLIEGEADIVRPFGGTAVAISGTWRDPVIERRQADEADDQVTTGSAEAAATGG